jgi:hypothetical protein
MTIAAKTATMMRARPGIQFSICGIAYRDWIVPQMRTATSAPEQQGGAPDDKLIADANEIPVQLIGIRQPATV